VFHLHGNDDNDDGGEYGGDLMVHASGRWYHTDRAHAHLGAYGFCDGNIAPMERYLNGLPVFYDVVEGRRVPYLPEPVWNVMSAIHFPFQPFLPVNESWWSELREHNSTLC
jgi:hypothetical protein